jgi:hypothetical protein
MLFAVSDYLRYRFEKGCYSRSRLEAQGFFLADAWSAYKLTGLVRDGDILFSQPRRAFASWIVMYFQGGPCSHVGTLTAEGTVLEAITSGVVERPVSVYFDGMHYLCIKRLRGIDDDRARKAVSWMRSQIGCRYAWGKVMALGFHILIGNHWDWRPRISLDAFIALLFLWGILYEVPRMQVAIAAIAILYAAVLLFCRWKMHRKYPNGISDILAPSDPLPDA